MGGPRPSISGRLIHNCSLERASQESSIHPAPLRPPSETGPGRSTAGTRLKGSALDELLAARRHRLRRCLPASTAEEQTVYCRDDIDEAGAARYGGDDCSHCCADGIWQPLPLTTRGPTRLAHSAPHSPPPSGFRGVACYPSRSTVPADRSSRSAAGLLQFPRAFHSRMWMALESWIVTLQPGA